MKTLRMALSFVLVFSLLLLPGVAMGSDLVFSDAPDPSMEKVSDPAESADSVLEDGTVLEEDSSLEEDVAGESTANDLFEPKNVVVDDLGSSLNKALDVSNKRAATALGAPISPASNSGSFFIKLKTSIAHPSVNIQYRESGTSAWQKGGYSNETTGYHMLSIPGSAIAEDQEYEYVVTFTTQSWSNIAAINVYKITGTIERDSSGAWTHVNKNGEASTWIAEELDGESFIARVETEPKYLKYKSQTVVVGSIPPEGFMQNFRVTDAMDGTDFGMGASAGANRLRLAIPTISADTSAAAKAALAAAGYPCVTASGAGAGETAAAAILYPYSCTVPFFHPATGVISSTASHVGAAVAGSITADAGSKHEVVLASSAMWNTFDLRLDRSAYSIMIRGLFENTELKGLTPADEALVSFENNAGVVTAVFDVDSGVETVSFQAMRDGLYTILFTFTIDADSDTVTFDNEAEAAEYAESLSFSDGIVTVKQLPRLSVIDVGSEAVASSGSLFSYIQATRSYEPGRVALGSFHIVNDNPDVSYRVVDYRIDPSYQPFENLLRVDSPAIKKCFEKYRLSSDPLAYSLAYIYDFESLTGKSLSSALLEMYQEDYPGITSLDELPIAVITQEILHDEGRYPLVAQGVDISFPNVVQANSGYVVLETDQVLIDLANKVLYEHALSITFDNQLYPLLPHLNDSGELDQASDERLRLLYASYRDQTDANYDMMHSILEQLSVLRPAGQAGDAMEFNSFAFGVNGNYINNPYRFSNYEFNFDFNLILSVVGIEGIAFVDANENGVYDNNEAVLADVEFSLFKPDGTLYGTYKTDEHGRYVIPNVAENDGYWMEVELPNGYELTSVVSSDLLGNKFLSGTKATDLFNVELDQAYRVNAGFVVSDSFKNTVTYHSNGGEGIIIDIDSPYVPGSSVVVLPDTYEDDYSTGFEREGYTFIGWNKASDGSGNDRQPDEVITIQNDIDLYAQWEPDPVTPSPDPTNPGKSTTTADPGNAPIAKTGDDLFGIIAALFVLLGVAGTAGALAYRRIAKKR